MVHAETPMQIIHTFEGYQSFDGVSQGIMTEHMNATIQIILLLGAVQGLLLSIFLFSIRTNRIANRLLAFLALIWGIVLMVFALQERGLYLRFPHLSMVFGQLIFLLFPLLFLHTKYLLTRHSKFQLKDLLHFLPFLLSTLAFMDFYIKSAEQKVALMQDPTGYFLIIQVIGNEIIAFQGIIYSILALVMIRKYQKMIKHYESTIEKRIIKVLYAGILLNLFSWTIGIVGLHLEYLDIDFGFDYFAYTYLVLVLVIYVISYAAVTSPEIFKLESLTDPYSSAIAAHRGAASMEAESAKVEGKESADNNQFLEDPVNIELNERLIRYMNNEKPYLNPELSLPELADSLATSRNQLSGVINRFHEVNFYEFVNHYRVEEVKRLMQDERNKNYKLISLAYDAGFNSKASFFRIFKQLTKMTPAEYLGSL